MCGIAGILGQANRGTLEKMLQATKHRGPNHTGVYVEDNIAIGMNRLSIIDTSEAGNQPMYDDHGRFVMIFNGEVYNFKELREDLKKVGFQFKSNSDSEVVLKMFLHHGPNCLKYLRGMFALFIWDKQEQKGFAARDHFGIKPFLYHFQNGIFTFCSEMKGMFANPAIERNLNLQALNHFLQTAYVPPELTFISGIRALKPGHYLEFENGSIRINSYWEFPAGINTKIKSFEEAAEISKELLLKSVKEQMISDVPLGVFLSGGMDSSVVVAAMRKAGVSDIKTFSLGFADDDSTYNETNAATESAKFYQTTHQNIIVEPSEVQSEIGHFIEALDQPSVDGINSFLIAKHTVKEVTVALSGLGGDEVFNGYGLIKNQYQTKQWRRYLGQALNGFNKIDAFRKKISSSDRLYSWLSAKSLTNGYIEGFSWILFRDQLGEQLFDNGIFSSKNIELDPFYSDIEKNHSSLNKLQKLTLLDFRGFMGSRLLRDSDAVTMYHSLELRPPILDKRLVEFAFTLPDNYKINTEKQKGQNAYGKQGVKKLLFEGFKDDLVPNFHKRKVSGFHLPINHWMRTILKEKIDTTFREKIPTAFNKAYFQNLQNNWASDKKSWRKTWLLFILLEWMDKYQVSISK